MGLCGSSNADKDLVSSLPGYVFVMLKCKSLPLLAAQTPEEIERRKQEVASTKKIDTEMGTAKHEDEAWHKVVNKRGPFDASADSVGWVRSCYCSALASRGRAHCSSK
jgi:hypothetical protein